MSNFDSIESLAAEKGISARTAYRHLKSGKIKRKREGGRTFFLVNEESSDDKIDRPRVSAKMSHADRKDVNLNVNDRAAGRSVSVSVESLKSEVESKRLGFELRKLEELERRSEEKLEQEREEAMEAEAEMRREEVTLRLEQERLERQKKERAEKIRRVKMATIPSLLMATIPPYILSLTLSEIESGLSKLDIENLSERELAVHAEAIRSRVWSDPANNREVRQAGVRAIFENLNTHLHQEYETAIKKGYTKSFPYFLGEIYLGMRPIQKQQLENFIERGC